MCVNGKPKLTGQDSFSFVKSTQNRDVLPCFSMTSDKCNGLLVNSGSSPWLNSYCVLCSSLLQVFCLFSLWSTSAQYSICTFHCILILLLVNLTKGLPIIYFYWKSFLLSLLLIFVLGNGSTLCILNHLFSRNSFITGNSCWKPPLTSVTVANQKLPPIVISTQKEPSYIN